MVRAICLAFAFLAATGAAYADDHLGIREFRLGMTVREFNAARSQYHWPHRVSGEDMVPNNLGKPSFLLKGIQPAYVFADTAEGNLLSAPLTKHTMNLPVSKITIVFALKDAAAVHGMLIDKYSAACQQWRPGAQHVTNTYDSWCTYETADVSWPHSSRQRDKWKLRSSQARISLERKESYDEEIPPQSLCGI